MAATGQHHRDLRRLRHGTLREEISIIAYSGAVHFSDRTPPILEENALARLRGQRSAQGLEVLDLTLSNPTRCGFDYPSDEIRAALSDPAVLAYDPLPTGARTTRVAVAAWHGHGLDPEDLVLTASTSEAYAWLFKLVGDPGDEVLVPSPSYPLFEWLARMEGLVARPVPAYRFDRWHLDLAGLELACGPRSRAVVVVNPNNPTGHFLSRAEWDALAAFCAARGLALIVDEVFADFVLEAPSDRLVTALEDPEPPCATFVLSGLSKVALLPQVKLGWIAVRGPEKAAALERLEFIADQYLSVSASAQAAAGALLRLAPGMQGPVLSRLRSNLTTLDNLLGGAPAWGRLPVEGGWSVILRRPALGTDEAFAQALLERSGVLIHPGGFYGIPGEGHLVLSLLTPEKAFYEGTGRILQS
jgi:aspartate/methionine/tyrosine aminotransferase